MTPAHTLIRWLLMIAILLGAFALRATSLAQFPPGISSDEAVNVLDAFHIVETGTFPLYQDFGRPDPLFRLVQAASAVIFGPFVWSFRFISALVGVLTVAAAYWATQQLLPDHRREVRYLAGIAAMIFLTIAIGHISITRSTYRAVPQPLFMLMAIGFILRGLRQDAARDGVLSGIFVSLGLYTYTAAFVVPLAFAALVAPLILFKASRWRRWMSVLVACALTCAVISLPLMGRLITAPETVLGRAEAVALGDLNWPQRIQTMIEQFTVRGDENPQYNAAHAPILPPIVAPLFGLGLFALLLRISQPGSWLIVALLMLATLPALATNEITHGLRVFGTFGTLPLIVGAGAAFLLRVLDAVLSRRVVYAIGGIASIVLLVAGSLQSWQTYSHYWLEADQWQKWRVYGQELNHNDWFFRPDRQALADWIAAQDTPLLVPVDELNHIRTRTYLLPHYHDVNATDRRRTIPDYVRVLIPFALELGGLRDDTLLYALLDAGEITLLPPLMPEAQRRLTENIETANPIPADGPLNLLGYWRDVDGSQIAFADNEYSTAVNFGDEVMLAAWYGPDTLLPNTSATTQIFTLQWQPERRLGFEYWSFLQVLTQDFERVAGSQDAYILRWLYPTTRWQPNDHVWDAHRMTIPPLKPGAYRLAAGVYPTFGPRLTAKDIDQREGSDIVTIGWLKVPQTEAVTIPDEALSVDAQLGDAFNLRGATLRRAADTLTIDLYWQSRIDRPALNATVFVHLVDDTGQIITQSDKRPWNGQYPTFIWDEGEIVQTTHTLTFSEEDLSEMTLRAGMYTFPGPTNLPVVQNGETRQPPVVDLTALLQTGN